MTGVQTRRTGTGYKAAMTGAIEHWIETPDTRSDGVVVNPAGPEPGTHRLTVGDLHACSQGLPAGQPVGTGMEKSAEAVVAAGTSAPKDASFVAACEGPNLLTQGSSTPKEAPLAREPG